MREPIFNKVVEVLSRLNEHGVEYKVFGGVALIAQGVIRGVSCTIWRTNDS